MPRRRARTDLVTKCVGPRATGTSPRTCCPRRVIEHNTEGFAMSKKKFVLMLAVCAAVALGYEGGRLAPISSSQAQTASVQTSTSTLPDFSALVEQNGPAVVNISTTTAPVRTQMQLPQIPGDRKSTRLNSSHLVISYAVFCLKKKNSLSI